MDEDLITLDGRTFFFADADGRSRPSVPERLSPLTLRGIRVCGEEVDV